VHGSSVHAFQRDVLTPYQVIIRKPQRHCKMIARGKRVIGLRAVGLETCDFPIGRAIYRWDLTRFTTACSAASKPGTMRASRWALTDTSLNRRRRSNNGRSICGRR